MLHIYYGKGKGKTSAAIGLIIRASGYKKRIVFFRFLKPKSWLSGEDITLKKLPNLKEFRFDYSHPLFIKNFNSKKNKALKKEIRKSLRVLKTTAKQGDFDILVLDEFLNLLNLGLVNKKSIITLLKKLAEKEIILTGRNMPKDFYKIADYITEFKLVKHPFQKGILAREAIEY